MMQSAGHVTATLKAIKVTSEAVSVTANEKTDISFTQPSEIKILLGAPVVEIYGDNTINDINYLIIANDNLIRVQSSSSQKIKITRLFIGY